MLDDIPEDRRKEYKDAFEMFDKDKDGTITTKEFANVMRSLNQDPTEEELNEIKKLCMTTNNTIQARFEDVFKQMSAQWETALNAISLVQHKLIEFENPYSNNDIMYPPPPLPHN